MGSPLRAPATSGDDAPTAMYMYVEDVDAFHAHAVANGAAEVAPPADQFWGDRMSVVKDPDGYQWSFATNVGEFDPANMPAPPEG